MGQYHVIVSFTAQEYFDGHGFGAGVKLLEMVWSTGGAMEALGHKLQSDWKGHRIAVVGDYYEKGDLSAEALTGINLGKNEHFYSYVIRNFESGKPEELFVNPNSEDHVIMNYSKNEYITPEGYGDDPNPNIFSREGADGGVMEALVILLAASCKGGPRGGGDIDSDSELVGSWAGDSIAIIPVTKLPLDAFCLDSPMRGLMEDANEAKYYEQYGHIVRSWLVGA